MLSPNPVNVIPKSAGSSWRQTTCCLRHSSNDQEGAKVTFKRVLWSHSSQWEQTTRTGHKDKSVVIGRPSKVSFPIAIKENTGKQMPIYNITSVGHGRRTDAGKAKQEAETWAERSSSPSSKAVALGGSDHPQGDGPFSSLLCCPCFSNF